jgi:hypothetical protein
MEEREDGLWRGYNQQSALDEYVMQVRCAAESLDRNIELNRVLCTGDVHQHVSGKEGHEVT